MKLSNQRIKLPERIERLIKNKLAQEVMDFIEAHPDKVWDWRDISSSGIFTMDFIEKHQDKPWDWKYIKENFPLKFQYSYMRNIKNYPVNLEWRYEEEVKKHGVA